MVGRPRLPNDVARITGAVEKNAGRFADRADPKVARLGQAPEYLNDEEKQAWDLIASEMPWLGASDRMIVEMASRVRAKMKEGPLSITAATEMRQILNALGATPAARSKVLEHLLLSGDFR